MEASSNNVINGSLSPPDDITRRDLRGTDLWRDVTKHFQDLISPSFGKVSDAANPELSPDGRTVVFTGTIWEKLEGSPQKRVCTIDVATSKLEVITHGPNDDQGAKWSPDGRSLAFLSDRTVKGTLHLYILNMGQLREAKPVRLPSGETAEYTSWSPTGHHVLIGAAGQSADKAGGQGSGTLAPGDNGEQLPAWMPSVEPDGQKHLDRKVWLYDLAKDELRQVSRAGHNIWEASWCGPKKIVVVASDGPSESTWYDSTLDIIDIDIAADHTIYRSHVQVGMPTASPSGSQVVVIEGLYSDRGLCCGYPVLINVESEKSTQLETAGVDASQVSFLDEDNVFFVGLRGLHTVAGQVNVHSNKTCETWKTSDTIGQWFPLASQIVDGSFAVVRSSWTRYPEIALVRDTCKTLLSLEHEGASYLRSVCGPIEVTSWPAPDGTTIEGFLCSPKSGKKPYPLVLNVHGGPIWAFTNAWQMRYPWIPICVSRGYAVLSVNPRGSKGRGAEFAGRVQGDMGGDDVGDLLSGVDSLVEKGIVDTKRVGVTGGSYGGFMAAWIITQTKRFAASIALAPVTDWFSQHTMSNIPKFDHLMLQDDPYASHGQYHDRSALRLVQNCSTPCLQLVGSEDRCTPAAQALQFHNALLEHGVESVLVSYPGEGHGVRKYPGVIDFCHRMVSWLQRHMPA